MLDALRSTAENHSLTSWNAAAVSACGGRGRWSRPPAVTLEGPSGMHVSSRPRVLRPASAPAILTLACAWQAVHAEDRVRVRSRSGSSPTSPTWRMMPGKAEDPVLKESRRRPTMSRPNSRRLARSRPRRRRLLPAFYHQRIAHVGNPARAQPGGAWMARASRPTRRPTSARWPSGPGERSRMCPWFSPATESRPKTPGESSTTTTMKVLTSKGRRVLLIRQRASAGQGRQPVRRQA